MRKHGVDQLALPAHATLNPRFDAALLGGVVALEGDGAGVSAKGWSDTLYRTAPPETRSCNVRAVPYYAWDNREAGAMTVWVRET